MSEENLHRDFEQVLGSFLSGELSPDELSLFQEELRRDPAKQKLLDETRLIWEGASPEHSYDMDAEWALMQEKLPGFGIMECVVVIQI